MVWLKKRTYPDFWGNYVDSFKNKPGLDVDSIRFVVFDTETTGLDIKKDRILSIGTVAVTRGQVNVGDQLECYVQQEKFKSETVKIHGILKKGTLDKIEEHQAIQLFLKHVGNAVLVAHHAAFDVAMVNASLKRMGLPKLKNKVLDTSVLFLKTKLDTSKSHFSLDELSKRFKIPQHDRHTASGDAFITALLFLKLLAKLKSNPKLTLRELEKPPNRIGLL